MHTPRMNYRQSISLNEAVMEAMMGKKPMQADLEKMSGDERETLRKHLTAYKNNQKELEQIVVQAAVEDGRMEAGDMEEEAGAMGGRGGAAPPAGGTARGGFGGFGGPGRPTGTRPGKQPDIRKKGKKSGKKKLPLPKIPPWLKDPKLLPFDVDPAFTDKLFKKVTKGLSDLTGIEENDEVNRFLKKKFWNKIPGLDLINEILDILDKIDTDKKKDGEGEGEGEGGNQPG